jgi:hypothetical protein
MVVQVTMSKTLIYLVAIFALWMYFSFGTFETSTKTAEKPTIKDFDNAQSGHGGTLVSTDGKNVFVDHSSQLGHGRSGKF